MSTKAAAQILSKGPLSSALGQWIFVGFGTLVIFTGDNNISRASQEIASVAFRLLTGRDTGFSGAALLKEVALSHQAGSAALKTQQQQQPIVIHSVSSHSTANESGAGWTIIKMGLGAGACWTAYLIISNCLPDQIKEMLPVTRRFFETAVTSLGQGIIRVREALSEQIALLGLKQDELISKQNETHGQVLGLKDDIGDVRLHIDDIAVVISRCESSLTDAAGRQTYMSRGVRLLVQCVGDLLRSSDPAIAEELDQFRRLSAELMDGNDFTVSKQLNCPSSPNLSEIGSATSATNGDDHYRNGSSNMQSLSLPRLPRSDYSTVTPSSSKNITSNSTSKVTMTSNQSHNNCDTISPPPLMERCSSSPAALKMFPSFYHGNRRNSGGGSTAMATTSSSSSSSGSSSSPMNLSRSNSSPENEVPSPLRFEDMNMEEKLRFIQRGVLG